MTYAVFRFPYVVCRMSCVPISGSWGAALCALCATIVIIICRNSIIII